MDFKVNSRQELLIFNRITSYIKDLFDLDNIILSDDDEGVIIARNDDWDTYFIIYFPEYWNPDNESGRKMLEDSPILQVEQNYKQNLDDLFGNRWEEPMKQFMKNNFNVEIKTILKRK